MDWLITGAWTVAWLPWQLQPPQWEATFIVKGTFTLVPDGSATWHPEPRHPTGPTHLDDDPERAPVYPEDYVPWKPRVDVLAAGACHAPGPDTTACEVGLRIGDWHKTLLAVGDRFWKAGLLGARPSEAQPFSRLPLTWEQALGGPGHAPNPVGRGLTDTLTGDGERVRWLPNLELPGAVVGSRRDRPTPAGFGPLPMAWPQRARKLGHYGGDWLSERWPWYAADLDPGFFNAAPEDQQLAGLRGDEELVLTNQHPGHPVLRCRLPGLRPRCLLTPREPGREPAAPDLILDTCWVDAEAEILVLVWRGRLPVADPDLAEWADCHVSGEPLTVPRELETLVAERADLLAAVAEEEQQEEAEPAEGATTAATVEGDTPAPGTAAPDPEKLLAAARQEIEAALAPLAADPAVPAGALTIPTTPATPPAIEDPGAAIRAAVAEIGDALSAADEPLPPELQALADDPPVPPPEEPGEPEPEPPPPPTRESVLANLAAGGSLAGRDLTGLDLAGTDLSGAKLARAVLARADLSGARLEEADLAGAVLVEADLSGVRARAARFAEADLTGTRLAGADLQEANLDEAILAEVDARGVDCRRGSWRGTQADAAVMAEARCDGLDLTGASLAGADLTGCHLAGADLTDADLQGARGADVDLAGATARGLKAAGAELPGLVLREAEADGAIFEDADLAGADLHRARLRDAECSGADLSGANLDQCDAARARFVGARLAGAHLRRCNLLRADLQGADLSAADCREANCFEAEFWQVVREGADFTGANLALTKLALIAHGRLRP